MIELVKKNRTKGKTQRLEILRKKLKKERETTESVCLVGYFICFLSLYPYTHKLSMPK